MKKQSGKKLVEILAVELKEWPEGAVLVMQDINCEVICESCTGHNWDIFVATELSCDWDTQSVTRAQWEAERAKLSKPKANAQGWVRNRGRKNPLDVCTLVDARLRSGDVVTGKFSENLHWVHTGNNSDLMAYRVNESVDTASPEVTAPVDGPLQWRDRITEIDRAVEALEEERASLIQKLADEGFKLIKWDAVELQAQDKPKAGTASVPPEEWQVGDILLACGSCGGFDFAGELVTILELVDGGGFEVATSDEPDYGWYFMADEVETDLRFHSRPTK